MMQIAFTNFIQKAELFSSKDYILLALSGGIDSMVMAELFRQSNYQYKIIHCNFKLRGEASDADAIFLKDYAAKYQVKFLEKVLPIKFESKKSVQMQARDLRYAWFKELIQKGEGDKVATAHHLDDALETLLLNLTRGSGFAGLRSIEPKRGYFVRPLLFTNKAQIAAYAQSKNLTWREDSSNASLKYRRNQMRHQVIPQLKTLNPNLSQTFKDTWERLQSSNRLLATLLTQQKQDCTSEEGDSLIILFDKLEKLPEPLLTLHYILQDYGFNYTQSREIWETRKGLSGRKFISKYFTLLCNRNQLIISKIQAVKLNKADVWKITSDEQQYLNTSYFHLECKILHSTDNLELNLPSSEVFLDADKLSFPLELRVWQEGERFQPLGLKGKSKKVSDFLINQKISRNQKENVLVLISAGQITWVVGHRLDDRFKITPQTQRIFYLKYFQTKSSEVKTQ